jgi:hypothetical protein
VSAPEAMSTPLESSGNAEVPVYVTFDEDDEHADSDRQAASDDMGTDYTTPGAHNVSSHSSHEKISSTLHQHPSPPGKAPLPAFIAPLPIRMPNEDLDFLALKGAFTVPEPELCAEILRGYIFCVHPFLPLLDLKPFVNAVLNEREDGNISLLLFQAVMFAGLSSLELHVVHRLGFESAKQAREVFFTRVKLLHEFDVELDGIAIFQSLLLMSSWYSKWNEGRDTWYWAGLAVSVSQNLGLHREPTAACGSDRMQRFRRRLWWSVYIRDRMLALGTRRPIRIRDEDFDVAMLTMEDFEVEHFDEFDHGRPLVPDAEEQKRTALMCVKLAKLCVCIGHVLSSQYTTQTTQPNVPHKIMVVPRRDGQRISELEECDREINGWLQALDPNLCKPDSRPSQDGSHSCSEVHWAMLNMTHLTLVNVLHRTQALQPLSDAAEAQSVQRASRCKVRDAARNVTKIVQKMMRHNQVRFLGLNGITALLAACLSHMVDIRSGDEDVRDASIFRFYQSMQVLQSMRMMYATADAAVSFLASVIRKAGLPVPAQVSTSAPYLMPAPAEGLVQPTTPGMRNPGPNDTAAQDKMWPIAQPPPYAARAGWQVTHCQPRTTPMVSPNQQVLPASNGIHRIPMGATVNPSSETFGVSVPNHNSIIGAKEAPVRENNVFNLIDAPSTILSNSVGNDPFLEWNCSLDTGIDFEPIAFNYDVFSDAAGFLDGHLQNI